MTSQTFRGLVLVAPWPERRREGVEVQGSSELPGERLRRRAEITDDLGRREQRCRRYEYARENQLRHWLPPRLPVFSPDRRSFADEV